MPPYSGVHIAHDSGIANGIRADCPRCMGYQLGDLDSENIKNVTGMSWNELNNWFDQGPKGIEQIFRNLPVYNLLVESGKLDKILNNKEEGDWSG